MARADDVDTQSIARTQYLSRCHNLKCGFCILFTSPLTPAKYKTLIEVGSPRRCCCMECTEHARALASTSGRTIAGHGARKRSTAQTQAPKATFVAVMSTAVRPCMQMSQQPGALQRHADEDCLPCRGTRHCQHHHGRHLGTLHRVHHA